MPNIITVTGPSGSGKSVILKMIQNSGNGYYILPKYTTRPRRKDDDESIINVDTLPEGCDYRYSQYGQTYGFMSEDIYNYLKQGKKPIIVINDEVVLEQLHRKFGTRIQSYFIHRGKPNIQKLISICNDRGVTDPEVIQARFQVARNIYGMYTDRIDLFDNIILNTGSLEETQNIVAQLYGRNGSNFLRAPITQGNKIFVVAGNPGSGKDYIIKAANKLGCKQIPKHTSRRRNPNDGSEMICCDDKDFDINGCNLKYKNYGETTYGIKTKDIWENLICGNSHQLLVCSNVETIKALKEGFGECVVVLYVHSDITPEEYRAEEHRQGSSSQYIQDRINGFKNAHRDYVSNISLYDKCLIYADDEKELLRQLAGVLGIKVNERTNNKNAREEDYGKY